MGKAAKGSRKGKKAWRANISTADIEDYFEKATRDTLSGAAAVPHLPDEALFVLSSSSSSSSFSDPTVVDNNNKKKKTDVNKEKILRHESCLVKNENVVTIGSSKVHPFQKSSKTKKLEMLQKRKRSVDDPEPVTAVTATVVVTGNDNGDENSNSDVLNFDLWGDGDSNSNIQNVKKRSTMMAAAPIPAVEIEPLGCSFNPPFEAHQDALAKAVADEMQKQYKKELQPEPVPRTVVGELVSEEERFFLDADIGNDEDDDEGVDDGDDLSAQRKSKTKKVTRVVENRRARRKEILRAEAEAKKIQNLSKEIDSLSDIMKEIEKEDEEKERRHTRRVVAKEERLKTAPPRIGKSKYVPPPVQVLLTEEITGSLRKLKGCCTLARDRFKSLEKRALIVPRANKRRRF